MSKDFWEQVYSTRQAEKLGWYRPRFDLSLDWMHEIELADHAVIIDVGGGASTFVDDLVDEGYLSITVFDISESALDVSRRRLGLQSDMVMWLNGDITNYRLPPHRFDFWHDRGSLHFLVDEGDRNAYRDNLLNALKPGGHCMISTFSKDAPDKSGGLAVQRYDKDSTSGRAGRRL